MGMNAGLTLLPLLLLLPPTSSLPVLTSLQPLWSWNRTVALRGCRLPRGGAALLADIPSLCSGCLCLGESPLPPGSACGRIQQLLLRVEPQLGLQSGNALLTALRVNIPGAQVERSCGRMLLSRA